MSIYKNTPASEQLNKGAKEDGIEQNHYSIEKDQMKAFYEVLFSYASEGVVAIRAFSGNDKPFNMHQWGMIPCSEPERVLNTAFRLAQSCAERPEEKVVFCPPVCTFNTTGKASEKDLCEGLALSVELDENDPVKAKEMLSGILGILPTATVISGGEIVDPSSGEIQNKLHLHWRLSEPAIEPEEHRDLKEARALATALVGGDATNVPAVHPIRWPGSWHTKGKPRLCRIDSLNPDAEIHLGDALEALREAAKDLPDAVRVETQKDKTRKSEQHYLNLQDSIRSGEMYHESLVSISARRAANGMNERAIIEELEALMNASEGARDERWETRFNDIPRIVRSAMQFAPEIDPDTPADMDKLFKYIDENAPVQGWHIIPFGMDTEPDLSHDALALDLSKAGFSKDARHVHKWDNWFFWTGTHWKKDEKLLHYTAAREFLRVKAQKVIEWSRKKAMQAESDKEAKKVLKWGADNAKAIRQGTTIASVENLARSNPDLVATVEQFDADLDYLGTPNGTVNLKTGELLPPARNHWITKQTGVTPAEPGTPAPLWESFLNRTFAGDQELIKFMQRAAGYALTGHVGEHKLLFLFGTGSNGKSVFLNTIYGIMGDYSKRAAAQTFLNSAGDRHPTDLAGLHGARLVVGSELPAGKAWNEAVIKDLTGGDIITARFMRADFFDFMPQFTLFIAGNHRPSFSGIDEAIRRRVCLIPFTQTIPKEERDPDLPEKLKTEWAAILRWMIDGADEWHRVGLQVPESVTAASEEYMEDEDTLSDFFEENLEESFVEKVLVSDMYERFTKWQRAQGVRQVWQKRAMSTAFAERGIKSRKSGAHYYPGYRLKEEPPHYKRNFFDFEPH